MSASLFLSLFLSRCLFFSYIYMLGGYRRKANIRRIFIYMYIYIYIYIIFGRVCAKQHAHIFNRCSKTPATECQPLHSAAKLSELAESPNSNLTRTNSPKVASIEPRLPMASLKPSYQNWLNVPTQIPQEPPRRSWRESSSGCQWLASKK